jgi:hypothetical protein
LSGFKQERAGVTILPALLNNLSEVVLVAATHKYFLATVPELKLLLNEWYKGGHFSLVRFF